MQTLRDIERDHILAALERTNWQATAARAYLGLTKRQFFYRCHHFGIRVRSRGQGPQPGSGDARDASIAGNPPCPLCQSSAMLEPHPDHPKLAVCARLKCMYERTRLKSQAQRNTLVAVEREERSA